ncbi:tyrosine-type recombinase/integrase [Neorhizobium huautlense]|nr:tyrosine-type recombinase/integrase [Neorhizobium huautlense]
MQDMPRKLPLNVIREKNRHGTIVFYYRVGKGPRTRLAGEPGTEEFKQSYRDAIAAEQPARPRQRGDSRTLKWLIGQYMESRQWADLATSTRKARGNLFIQMLKNAGDSFFADISKKDVEAALDARAGTPGQANALLKALRGVFEWAVKADLTGFDPTHGVDRLQYKTDGFEPWTSEDVHKFCLKWKIGTPQRLAMELLLCSGLRRSDIVRAGRQHMSGNTFTLRTHKTGAEITVEFPDRLMKVIEKTKTGDLAFIVGENGRPFTVESFGNWFRKHCTKADVDKSAHGLRKLSATLAANAGASSHELMAQYGWATSRQAEIYTKKADRKRLGIRASKLVAEQIEIELAPHLNPGAGNIQNTEAKTTVKK